MRVQALTISALLVLAGTSVWAGSLWRESITDEHGMFADKIARRVGDIVTITVDESVKSVNSLATTTAKTANSNGGIVSNLVGQFVAGANQKLQGGNDPLGRFPLNILPRPNGGVNLPTPLASGGTSAFKGGGDIANTQTMTASMAVQVVDRLPNGNLVIEGIRQVSFSKERQFASLRGIIRPYDISTTNTVASSAVADARIEIVSEGTLTDSQKKGWLLRLDEKISPY